MRLGIFSFYNKWGIVGDYVEYLLTDLTRDRTIIVVNGNLNEPGKNRFERFSNEIIIRENRGFDGGAYADVICNYLSEEVIREYDELVLCNDTFYGPFVHFDEMFKSMEAKKFDFWGINEEMYGAGIIGEHICSFFLVIGGRFA
jgi:rhamnosyltransferase